MVTSVLIFVLTGIMSLNGLSFKSARPEPQPCASGSCGAEFKNLLFKKYHFREVKIKEIRQTYPTANQSPDGQYPREKICDVKSCC